MFAEGMKVYFVEDGNVHSGYVIDVEKKEWGFSFSIDSYGGCEGNYRIHSDQIGITVFERREQAEASVKFT